MNMGEYEPNDSRNVTLKQERAPGEPPRTGPQEAATRQQEGQAGETELEQDERGKDAEQNAALERDEDEAAEDFDRSD
jgi:hypothetical protein